MKRVLTVALVLAFFVLSFAAEKYVYFDENTPYLGAKATGKPGGTLIAPQLGSGPKTVNPIVAQETSSTAVINVFLISLIEMDNYARMYPALAERCEVEVTDDEKMIITLKIRKGIKWSDGAPFTADDFVFSLNDIYCNPDIPNDMANLLEDSQGRLPVAEKVDDYTVKITYQEPYRLAVRYAAGIQILPKHIAEPWVKQGKFKEMWTVDAINKKELVGLGPFIPVEYVPDQFVRMVKNPYYYKKDANGQQLPYLDEYVLKIIPDLNAIRLAFENGEIDVYGVTAQFYPEIKNKAKEKGWIVGTGGPNFGTTFVTLNFNCTDPVKRSWFRNEFFRKAIAYSMDKDAMIDTLLAGLGVAQWGPISAAAAAFYNDDVLRKYPYDLDYARMMLQLGGFSWDKDGNCVDASGNKVEFILMTNAGNTQREGTCNILRDELAKLGIKVVFTPIDFNTLVQKMTATGDWDAIVIGLTGSDEPQGGANVWKLDGALHFWNYSPKVKNFVSADIYEAPDWEVEIDKIFRENVRILDQKKVYQMFSRYQELVSEHLPLIYTIQQNYLYAYVDKLQNLEPTAFGGMLWNIDWIWKK
ncbi:MAG TPA: ABC transporter substrate-binding protein [Pseudothermotoga sp.]|nr:ABC transporter substrate-binding protein [Pseudothermotoga sp.]HOK84203.1 ABC transporter substrate-binding protein [Pseudothermotoga sp.]HPP69203.1 ABC transporter substrate-binding protein [Pseudothermotoga sp.]